MYAGSLGASDFYPGTRGDRCHATYLATICQAMSSSDLHFLANRAPARSLRKAHRERQRIAALYLSELRSDFHSLLRLARMIATLSPEVRATDELERLRLALWFFCRYHLLLGALYSGLLLLPQLCSLTMFVSHLAARMDDATRQLGERAAMAADLASSRRGRRLGLI